ncbi:hypothetical protein FACS189490_11470 [Clostridia bacterium]|nr:hypothetical protein FACS189490_11470 [Clostridia bacterium]
MTNFEKWKDRLDKKDAEVLRPIEDFLKWANGKVPDDPVIPKCCNSHDCLRCLCSACYVAKKSLPYCCQPHYRYEVTYSCASYDAREDLND